MIDVYTSGRHDYYKLMAGKPERNFWTVKNEYRKLNVQNLRRISLDPNILSLKDIENNAWMWTKWWPDQGYGQLNVRYSPYPGRPNPVGFDYNYDLFLGECMPTQLFGKNAGSEGTWRWNLKTIHLKAIALGYQHSEGRRLSKDVKTMTEEEKQSIVAFRQAEADDAKQRWMERVMLCAFCGVSTYKLPDHWKSAHADCEWEQALISELTA